LLAAELPGGRCEDCKFFWPFSCVNFLGHASSWTHKGPLGAAFFIVDKETADKELVVDKFLGVACC
jgi:hypothetical protein